MRRAILHQLGILEVTVLRWQSLFYGGSLRLPFLAHGYAVKFSQVVINEWALV